MAEYTQEQLDAMIQAESDRRVNQALQNREIKYKEELENALKLEREKVSKELEEKSKLTAEELARKEFEEKLSEIQNKEIEISKKSNLLSAKEMLNTAGISKEKYDKVLDMLVSDNNDVTKQNVEKFIGVFNDTKSEIENKIRAELSKISQPQIGGSNGEITKTEFDKMTYSQKLELKIKNKELYDTFMK